MTAAGPATGEPLLSATDQMRAKYALVCALANLALAAGTEALANAESPARFLVQQLLQVRLTAIAVGPATSAEEQRKPELADPMLAPAVLPPAGPRLSVAGIVSDSGGSTERVKPLDDQATLTFGADSGYWLVQLDAAGKELQRTGWEPIRLVERQRGEHRVPGEMRFAAPDAAPGRRPAHAPAQGGRLHRDRRKSQSRQYGEGKPAHYPP